MTSLIPSVRRKFGNFWERLYGILKKAHCAFVIMIFVDFLNPVESAGFDNDVKEQFNSECKRLKSLHN